MVRLVVSVTVLVVLLLSGSASGHGPSGVDASFDVETHILQIRVFHAVRDAGHHYVNKITVELNGKKIIEQHFKSQVDKEHQEALFMIRDAEIGDEMEITAGCNISGKKKVSIEVIAPEPAEESS